MGNLDIGSPLALARGGGSKTQYHFRNEIDPNKINVLFSRATNRQDTEGRHRLLDAIGAFDDTFPEN